MKGKRLSLRFREENDRDMEAWNKLEAEAVEKNISKNSLLVDLILQGENRKKEIDEEVFAERVAGIIADRIMSIHGISMTICDDGSAVACSRHDEQAAALAADEPMDIGEAALDFLDAFS